MSCVTTARNTTVAILAIATYEEESEISKSSDIDLSRKCNYSFYRYSCQHLSCRMFACCGVAESNESEDIVLSNCEAETGQSHTDKQQEYKKVNSMCFLDRVRFGEPGKEKQMQKKKVVGRKNRKRRRMKEKSWYLHHKTRYHRLIVEMTLQPYRRRHRKNCTLKRYRMFKFRMFLVLINLRVVVKRSDTSAQVKASDTSTSKGVTGGEDAEEAANELSLHFCFKTKKFSELHLCDLEKFNGQFSTVLCRRTYHGITDGIELEKASFKEDFEIVLHDELLIGYFVVTKHVLHFAVFGHSLVDNGESMLEKVPHRDVSGNRSVDIDENVLTSDVLINSSVEIDEKVLHNDVSGNSSVEIGEKVLHHDVSGNGSVEIGQKVLHNDVSGNSSVETGEKVLHHDASGNSSVEIDQNVLHDVLRNSPVKTDEKVLHNDVSENSSVEISEKVLHHDVSGNSSVEIGEKVLPNDVSENSSVEIDEKVLHDVLRNSPVKTDEKVLHSDVSENSSVEIDENVLHDVLRNSPVKTDEKVLHSDVSENSSVEIDENVLHDVLRNSPVKTDEKVLHSDVSENSSVEIDEDVLHDVLRNSPVKTDEKVLHIDVSENSSVEIDESVLLDVLRNSPVKTDEKVLHSDVSENSSVEIDEDVLHDVLRNSPVKTDEKVLHIDVSENSSVETDESVLLDVSRNSSVKTDEKVLHIDVSENSSAEIDESVLLDVLRNSSVKTDEKVLHIDVSENSSAEIDESVLLEVSRNSSVKTDEKVLHIDVSENSSAESDENVLLDVSRNSSVKTDEKVLHIDVSENSSVETDESVLLEVSRNSSVKTDENIVDDDVSADSSVEIDENVLYGDVSAETSFEISKNVPHSDVPADSSVHNDNNVLHDNVCVDSSVHIDNNVLHDNVCMDSSVHNENNLLHSDLSLDSSVHKENNILHRDLSPDSSVHKENNLLHSDLSPDSSVQNENNMIHDTVCRGSYAHIKDIPQNLSGDLFIKICANCVYKDLPESSCAETCENYPSNELSVSSSHDTVHDSSSVDNFVKFSGKFNDDLFENSWESVKISKNMCDDVKSEDNCFKLSKLFRSSKLNLSNAWNTKAIGSADWMLKSSGIDSIRSYMDIPRLLGIYPRYSHSLPMFWQEITLYPLTRSNNPPGDLLQLMCYEVFRLCSFSYARFPADFDVWVTHLAQAGFYCENEHGRIVCFSCGCEFCGPVGSSVDEVHHPDCQRLEHSRPLHVWTEGLNQEILAVYYSRYGSLRPYNFEVSGQQNLSDDAYTGLETTQASAVTEPQAQGYIEPASGGTSGEAEPGIPVLAEVTTGDSVIEEAARPEYHSQTLPADFTDRNRDPGFGDQLQSLPGNLNEVSGAIVSEESQDTPRSYQVLTSAASNPVPFYNQASRGGQSQAEDRNENGAVGGAGVTLDLSKASYPLFSSAEARRQSFTSWSRTHSHRPEDLVAAGFFYAGYADCVRCFYCGLGLKYWRPTDIPAYQHARYRPHCVYNRLYKGQDYIDRVQQDLQGTTEQLAEAAPPAQGEAMAAVVQRPNRVLAEVASVTTTPSVTAPSVPDLMNSEVAQEAMRNGWDRTQVQQAVDHIVREFGVHSLELSLLLDVLTNLNMDNPEPNLPSGGSVSSADSGVADPAVLPGTASVNSEVSARRGIDVADATHEEAGATPQPRAVPIQQPAVPPIEFNELFMSVEREHTLLAERTTCRLCRRRPVSCIYLPCGHVIACQECADNATHCILCSKQIIGTANIYLA